jgi:hypothetical protein
MWKSFRAKISVRARLAPHRNIPNSLLLVMYDISTGAVQAKAIECQLAADKAKGAEAKEAFLQLAQPR